MARWPAWASAGGMLLVLLVVLGLVRGRTSRLLVPTDAPESREDATETRLRQAVEASPNDGAAWSRLGEYELGQGHAFEAIWAFAEARRLSPANAALPLHLAAVLQAGQAVDMAVSTLTEASRSRPGDLDARHQQADLLIATGEPRRAQSLLEEGRPAVWQDAAAVITLGRARQAAGDDAGARAAFQRAVALESKNDEALYRLGRLSLRQGRLDEARDAFFHALFYRQSRPEYPFFAGLTYLQQGGPTSLGRALRFFRDTLALRPNDAPAQYESGVALERLGRRSAAITHYSLATVADPTDAEPLLALSRGLAAAGNVTDSHRYRARYYDRKDRPADAVREYRLMQAADPKSVEPALLIGQVYLRTRQNEAAIAVTAASLARHPRDAELLERLAVLNINRGDWPAARRLLQRWLVADPRASRPCWLLGRCALGELNYPEAIDWLEKAVAREPRNPHYLGYLGAALLKLPPAAGQERAAAVLAQAVAGAPEEAEYLDLYGQALERLGRPEAARHQFLRALDADPSRIAVYLAVSRLAWRLNRPGPANFFPTMLRAVQQRASDEALLQRHVWQHPDDSAGRLLLARFLCRHAKLTRARDELEQAEAHRPVSPEARALLVTVQRSLEAL